jgi:integrase
LLGVRAVRVWSEWLADSDPGLHVLLLEQQGDEEVGRAIDWTNSTVSFFRKKTGVPVLVHLGKEALNPFKELPAEGLLFPFLASMRPGNRTTEFGQRCRHLSIKGVTPHSYRYAWGKRAKTAGYPERFAQEALGHNSKAVHRAYTRRALVKIPSLEEYEQRAAQELTAPAH